MPTDRFRHERELMRQGCRRVAGVDEAGRGPLAGPVVAAAMALPAAWVDAGLPTELKGLNDSKQLSARARERYFDFLTSCGECAFGIARIEPARIDELNILVASHEAMLDALAQLHPQPDHVLVDGLPVHRIQVPQTAIVKGDSLSYSIAAASVLAKVTRDRIMEEMDRLYPVYKFDQHKGYPTAQHLEALARNGPCPIHRRSFAPVRSTQLNLFDEPRQ